MLFSSSTTRLGPSTHARSVFIAILSRHLRIPSCTLLSSITPTRILSPTYRSRFRLFRASTPPLVSLHWEIFGSTTPLLATSTSTSTFRPWIVPPSSSTLDFCIFLPAACSHCFARLQAGQLRHAARLAPGVSGSGIALQPAIQQGPAGWDGE